MTEPSQSKSDPNDEWKPFSCGDRVWIGGHNRALKGRVQRLLVGVQRPATGPVDGAVLAPASVDEAVYFAVKIRRRLRPSGPLWLVVDRTRAGDEQTGEALLKPFREALRLVGYEPRESVALDSDTMTLRFHRPPRSNTSQEDASSHR